MCDYTLQVVRSALNVGSQHKSQIIVYAIKELNCYICS